MPDLSCLGIPRDDGLPLVGDAYAQDIRAFCPYFLHCLDDTSAAVVPYFPRVMLNPPRLGENLLVLKLLRGNICPLLIKQNKTGTGSSLVQRSDILHTRPPHYA